jgi:hypothetical protein
MRMSAIPACVLSDEHARDVLVNLVPMQPVEGRRYLFVQETDWSAFRVERVEQNDVSTVITMTGWSKAVIGGSRMTLGDWLRLVREKTIIDGDTELTVADR